MRRHDTGTRASMPRVRRRRFAALLALGAAAGFYLSYLLAVNLFLATPVGPWAVNRRPQSVRVEWRRAWTPFPGLVQVEGLRVAGRTSRVRWSVDAERCRGRIDLPSLLLRRFRVRDLAGEGVRAAVAFVPERRGHLHGRPPPGGRTPGARQPRRGARRGPPGARPGGRARAGRGAPPGHRRRRRDRRRKVDGLPRRLAAPAGGEPRVARQPPGRRGTRATADRGAAGGHPAARRLPGRGPRAGRLRQPLLAGD